MSNNIFDTMKNYFNIKILRLIVVSFVFSLFTACGGGSDNTSTSQNSYKYYQGFVQKGPFEVGANVSIAQLDPFGTPTGKLITTKIEDLSGRFTYQLPNDWNIGEGASSLQISAEGFFFDESNGLRSDEKIKLRSITNTPESSSVNLLTDWAATRAETLLKNGQSLMSATDQSKKELIKIFGITNIHELDITQLDSFGADNALLLLLSGTLMEVAEQNAINPQHISNEIASDLSDDGKLTELGNDWFIRMQSIISNNSQFKINHYAKALNEKQGLDAPTENELPKVITLESRPSAILPIEIVVEPGASVMLDGRKSHDNSGENDGILTNYSWFVRADKNGHKVLFSDRYAANPTITVPDEETELIVALIITNKQKLTDSAIMKVIIKNKIIPNSPPIALDDTKSTQEDTPITLSVDDIITTNDTDADGDPLSITLVSNSTNGMAHLFSTGLVTFSPNTDFFGVASFDYTISDGKGGEDTATVTINVTAENDPPVITSNAETTSTEDVVYIYMPTAMDPDGDNLTWTISGQPTGMTIVASTGVVSWIPMEGDTTSGAVTISVTDDGTGRLTDTQIFTVLVGAVNDAPVITSTAGITATEDVAYIYTPTATDPDGDNLTWTISGQRADMIIDASTGVILWTPIEGVTTSGAVTITVTDDGIGELTDTQNFIVSVGAVNDPPTVVNDNYNIDQDTTLVFNPLDNDSDIEGDTLSIISINGIELREDLINLFLNAVLVYNEIQSIPVDNGTVNYDSLGVISFTPNANFVGNNVFPYVISDGKGGTDDAEVSIDVDATPVVGYFKASNPHGNDEYGASVSLSADGSTLAVGGRRAGEIIDPKLIHIYTLESTGWVLQSALTSLNFSVDDFLGLSLSISNDGNTLVVGASGEDAIGGSSSGAAYIFTRVGTTWSQTAYLKASNTQRGDNFGSSVSISGNGKVVAVGAPYEDSASGGVNADPSNNDAGESGAVYIFKLTNTFWVQDTYVKASTPKAGSIFGYSLSLDESGDSLLVGAPLYGVSVVSSGAVYYFEKNGSDWSQKQLIRPSTPIDWGVFGLSVALSNDGSTFASGAPDYTAYQGSGSASPGSVFVFKKNISWDEVSKITANNPDSGDLFGFSVAISADGNRLVVGAYLEDSNAVGTMLRNGADSTNNEAGDSGAAYIFDRVGIQWTQYDYVKASNTEMNDHFGFSVTLSDDGNSIAVGTPGEDNQSAGINPGASDDNSLSSAGAVYVNPHYYNVPDPIVPIVFPF